MFGLGLKERVKIEAGRAAAACFPRLLKEVQKGKLGGDQQWLKGLIARSEITRLDHRGQAVAAQKILTQRWTSENMPSSWYNAFSERGWQLFKGPHARIVDWLRAYAVEKEITQVIEVGCGNGRVLVALSDAVPTIPRWIGVDVNSEIIARCKTDYADHETLEFVVSDAADWLADHTRPGTLLMTNGGVMEYFAPETLLEWFALLKAKGGVGVLLVEPVDPSHDLEQDPGSHVWGGEQSYSHNHARLLERAGFRVVETATTNSMGYRWILMLADAERDGRAKA